MYKKIGLLMALLAASINIYARPSPPEHVASPWVVAHRAGTADYPENTLLAIEQALSHGSDALWLSVQMTADGDPVLYRPTDLSALTQGRGAIAQWTLAELQELNAGYHFKAPNGSYPYRYAAQRIPTLAQALAIIPDDVPIFLDLKSGPVEPLIDAVARTLDRLQAWSRVRFYSTQATANRYLAQHYASQAVQFESRDATRNRLVGLALGQPCAAPPEAGTWLGIELHRSLTVTERFTLGESSVEIPNVQLWTREALECVRTRGPVTVVMFGIETAKDYQTAQSLGADAVMTNSPAQMRGIRAQANTTPIAIGQSPQSDLHRAPAIKAMGEAL